MALGFSFVDPLASVAISPIGVADDDDPARLPADVRNIVGDWTSVGLRAQPSIEGTAALIANLNRHAGSYDALNAIALLRPSRGEDYGCRLQSAAVIGEAIGKVPEMTDRPWRTMPPRCRNGRR